MLVPRGAFSGHSRVHWVAMQAGIVALGVFFYFQVRGLTAAEPGIAFDHARDVLAFEKRLGLDFESAVQAPVTVSPVLETLANWVYIWGHWPVIIGVMAWLVWHHRPIFLRLRDAMLISGSLGLIVFVSYPLAPPRLVDIGLVDTVTEKSEAYRFLQPPNFVNQYAAMPSLHAGWDLLVGLAIAAAATTVVVRCIGYLLPAVMAFSVVATANHYVVDVIAGISLALVGFGCALLIERRRKSKEESSG